jgi:hypothetical protein
MERRQPARAARPSEEMTDAEIAARRALLEARSALYLGISVDELHARCRALAATIPPERREAYRGRSPESMSDEELKEAIACLEATIADLETTERHDR